MVKKNELKKRATFSGTIWDTPEERQQAEQQQDSGERELNCKMQGDGSHNSAAS